MIKGSDVGKLKKKQQTLSTEVFIQVSGKDYKNKQIWVRWELIRIQLRTTNKIKAVPLNINTMTVRLHSNHLL